MIKYIWNDLLLKENIDIMIDDGLHKFTANVCFFENSIHKLKQNGYYIMKFIYLKIKYNNYVLTIPST